MKTRNVIIIGGGISAHTAAVYTARADLSPLVLSGRGLDQLSQTSDVENYPGFPEGILGPDLISNAKKQAQKFGAEYIGDDVTGFKKVSGGYKLTTAKETYLGKTVIISSGASARKLGIPGEDTFFGRGVSTCATCDAPFFKDKKVVIVGGGDSAMEETMALYKFASEIHLVHRRDSFRASKIMQKRVLESKDKITIHYETETLEVLGDKFVSGVKIKDAAGESTLDCDGMFLAIGHIPNTAFLKGAVKLDNQGYIAVDGVKTSLPGVYAAGDVMDPHYRQAITSAGTGCMSALEAEKYLELLE
ncbi:MAG: thioredoxin-disulfide reductase [Nanoarchaeota archaeon]|nr:thioredoxin-disulfide reductase [Nanoarchaeota archaeon]